jgi:FtsZ-binding cell division protein ZapB
MELQSLENLEKQVSHLLDQYRSVKKERDELYERVSRLESEANELREANESLRIKADEARRNLRDPEKEERIRAKVDELLAKLEGF